MKAIFWMTIDDLIPKNGFLTNSHQIAFFCRHLCHFGQPKTLKISKISYFLAGFGKSDPPLTFSIVNYFFSTFRRTS